MTILIALLGFASAMAAPLTKRTMPVERDIRNAVTTDGQKVKFTVHVDYPQGFHFKDFHIYTTTNPYDRRYYDANKTMSWKSEPGIYYFVLTGDLDGEDYIMVTPEVEAYGDTELHYNFSDCTNSINFISMLPDGSEMCPNINKFDDLDNVVQEGNITGEFSNVIIARKGATMLTYNQFNAGMSRILMNDKLIYKQGGFFCNDLSSDYEVVCRHSFENISTKENTEIFHSINGAELRGDVVLQNKPEFAKIDADFTTPLPGPFDIPEGEWYRFVSSFKCADLWSDTGRVGSTFSQTERYTLLCDNLCDNNFVDIISAFGQCFTYNGLDNEKRSEYAIMSPRMIVKGNNATFMPSMTDEYFSYYYVNAPDGGTPFFLHQPYTIHPRFNWEWDYSTGKIPLFGNSVPCLTLATLWNKQTSANNMDPYLTGRLGELRICDKPISWVSVEKDGENVFTGNLFEIEGWSSDEFNTGRASGKYVINIEDDNVIIDETIPGINSTVITLNANKPDREPPTMTYLSFRDTNDAMTDRFATPGDGVLEFTAADFSSELHESGLPYFTCKDLKSLKVEYSPMDKESYSELSVEEIPELYHMPEFGHFYRASLAQVKAGSANGWFKLRFSLEDASGNTQVQTINPAFRIESAVGIDTLDQDSEISVKDGIISADGVIRLYDSIGRLIRKADYTLTVSDLTGIYIIKTVNKSVKVVL